MIRRLAALFGLLTLGACTTDSKSTPPPPPPVTTGTVTGTLTPFRPRATAVGTARPALLNDSGVRRRLTQAASRAYALNQEARRAALTVSHGSATTTADTEALPGEVIVRLEEGGLSEAQVLERVQLPGYRAVYKASITDHLHLVGYEALTLRSLAVGETGDILQRVTQLQGVRYAEKNVRVHAFKTPNDPGYGRQWHYPLMNLPAAWDITTGSDSIAVGIVDTGIVKHPDLNARVVQGADLISDSTAAGDGDGRDMDPTDMGKDEADGSSSWHGSHVAGTIGAVSNEGFGVSGVTWSGKLVPVRVLGRGGGSFADIGAGIQWAVGRHVTGLTDNANPVQVINMSLGGESPPSAALQEIIDDATSLGVVIVVAAGNDNVDASRFSPCNQQNVICVGATRYSGKRASYSDYGTAVHVMAAGGETAEDLNGDGKPDGVLSTILDTDGKTPIWAYYQGTSMASPHVAGIVALMKSVVSTKKPADLTLSLARQMLQDTADPTFKCTEGCGSGLVNAQAAVLKAKNGLDPSAPSKLGVGSTQLSFLGAGTQQLSVRNLGGGTLKVTASASGSSASALSFPNGASVTLSAYGSAALSVAVAPTGLASGDYSDQVVLTGDNGESTQVTVEFTVGTLETKDAYIAFAYVDDKGDFQVDQSGIVQVTSATGYSYSAQLVPKKEYYALASVDYDGDDQPFGDNDELGAWRDITDFESFDVELGQTVSHIDFAIVPPTSSGVPSAGAIGDACSTNTDCDNGLCDTSKPSGYCTLDCFTSHSCPAGSSCYYTSTAHTAARCYADCSSPGGQSSCRTGYTCYANSSGGGACDSP